MPGWSTAGPPAVAGQQAQRWEAAAGTPCPESPWPWPSVLEGSRWTDTPCYSWRQVGGEKNMGERLNKCQRQLKAVILFVIKQVSDYCAAVYKIRCDINVSIWMVNISNKLSWTNYNPCVNTPHFLWCGSIRYDDGFVWTGLRNGFRLNSGASREIAPLERVNRHVLDLMYRDFQPIKKQFVNEYRQYCNTHKLANLQKWIDSLRVAYFFQHFQRAASMLRQLGEKSQYILTRGCAATLGGACVPPGWTQVSLYVCLRWWRLEAEWERPDPRSVYQCKTQTVWAHRFR